MKLKTWTAGIAALVLSTAPVFAVEGAAQWTDSFVTPASCDNACCDPGCCDPVDCGDACHCGSGICGGGGLLSGIGNGAVEGFSFAGLLGLNECSWLEVGGWTQMGYHDSFEPISPQPGPPAVGARVENDALSFLDRPKEWNLHQQWFYAGHTADGSNGFDIGGRIDAVYGIDAKKTQAFGNPAGSWDEDWDYGDKGAYGWAIPQLYGEVAINDLAIKVGHFFTPLGYEVVPSTGNFFYSHALTMFNSEPFTHTGVLATYTGFESLTLYSGWSAGWDSGFDSANAGSNIISGFSAELVDSLTLTYLNTYGNFGLRSAGGVIGPNSEDDYSHSIVLNAGLTDKLSYIFQTDYLKIDNEAAGYRDEDVGINQYLIYQYSDVIGLGTRMEWWKNDSISNYALTSGVNIKLLGNLIIRPEARKDWVPATGFDQDMFAIDTILTY